MHPFFKDFALDLSNALNVDPRAWQPLTAQEGSALDPPISPDWNPVRTQVQLEDEPHIAVMHRFFASGGEGEPVLRIFKNDKAIGAPVPLQRATSAIAHLAKTGNFV